MVVRKKTISIVGFFLIGFIMIFNFVLTDTAFAGSADPSVRLRDGNATKATDLEGT